MESKETESGVLTALARQMRLSATLEINELVHRRTAQGYKVVHLGFGEATFPIQPNVAAAHREASDITSYLPVAGLTELREVGILDIIYRYYDNTDFWGRPLRNSNLGVSETAFGQTKLSWLQGPSHCYLHFLTFFKGMFCCRGHHGSVMSLKLSMQESKSSG